MSGRNSRRGSTDHWQEQEGDDSEAVVASGKLGQLRDGVRIASSHH